MGRVVLDSSVLLGLADPLDALHRSAAEALNDRRDMEFIVPASVFAEIMVGAVKLGKRTADHVEAMVDDLATDIYPIDREVARAAASIRARRTGIRLPDALVLATGTVLHAEVLTGDKRWAGEPGRVAVLGP
ncbi:MAG TPA: PIN domain-containing protein [Glycomyces sp.]|nr:PIN domain-containing protein [Glycomyces sp.]